MNPWILGAGVVLIALLLWELWICEGAHLGKHFVVWMYDLFARRYDRIKKFDPEWERRFLGEPLAAAARGFPGIRMLDVGAGTGRAARAMLPVVAEWLADEGRERPAAAGTHREGGPGFPGLFVNLEPSRRMLELGRRQSGESVHWLRSWAVPLPFAGESFDLVIALEMLEFTPDPAQTLREIHRVMRPGGLLLITNRVGWESPLILGRTTPRGRFADRLTEAGFQPSEPGPWQMDYDLAWGRKPWTPEGG